VVLLTLAVLSPQSAGAQESGSRFPFGSAVVLAPVQAAIPTADGAWPGHAATVEEALRAMDAELEFALADRRGADNWAVPSAIRQRVSRNPVLDVDPDRLAYQGLITAPDARDQLYEPLHGQLRTLAALFGTRYVILPVQLRIEPVPTAEALEAPECHDGGGRESAVLIVALIDIRRSAVMWHGEMSGAGVCAGSGSVLASLADMLAREIVAS
jgi:hypothetical protein